MQGIAGRRVNSPEQDPTPGVLMREWHPELFSDTQREDVLYVPPAVFEYHLDSLTSRKQEYEFEHLCRRLAEKEICPNLRPQTGPTGGGDSKVDTETYPVAPEIAERWWVGCTSSGSELWGFAFSAKKAWKSKVRADVDNILSTDRRYDRIYFFTNQFVKDKTRADTETVLSTRAAVPVHIMDRSWIVERVYAADPPQFRRYLAAVSIDPLTTETKEHRGPRDNLRVQELRRLDQKIADVADDEGSRYQLIEDCLQTALLARALERAREEVEARFDRAARLSRGLAYRPQQLRIAYNRAWTAFWWYEDYEQFISHYGATEGYVAASLEAQEVDLLLNLWMLLPKSVSTKRIAPEVANIDRRASFLTAKLETIANDSTRPNNALRARTGQILMESVQALESGTSEESDACWQKLRDVVEASAGLGDYSVSHLFKIVQAVSPNVDSPVFDALYNQLVAKVSELRGEGEAGMAYANRARQKIRHDKPYDAIRWLGRAEPLLSRKEYRREFVRTLILSGSVYEVVGLFWAARSRLLTAAERAFATFVQDGVFIPEALASLNRLIWIELQLGRIPHVLHAIELADFVRSQVTLSADESQRDSEERREQDFAIGWHMLNVDHADLGHATRLPCVLRRLGLPQARNALIFALGHEEQLRSDAQIPTQESSQSIETMFVKWHQEYVTMMPRRSVLGVGLSSEFESTILGIRVRVRARNAPTSFALTEAVLGSLESFLATSDEEQCFPAREEMSINVHVKEDLQGEPEFFFRDEDRGTATIVHSTRIGFRNTDEREGYLEWLRGTVIEILGSMFFARDVEAWMKEIVSEEGGLTRALLLGDTWTTDANVLGERPKVLTSDWIRDDDKTFAVRRPEGWRGAKIRHADRERLLREKLAEESRIRRPDRAQLRHTERRVRTPIDTDLWERAKWRATVFFGFEGAPPILGLGFEEASVGERIFQQWKKKWSDSEADVQLRIAIVTEISRERPAEYVVSVGPSLDGDTRESSRVVMYMARVNRMAARSRVNLDRFLNDYQKHGQYLLAPVEIAREATKVRLLARELAMVRTKLDLREAWTIGEHDSDLGVFSEDDEPIVPEGVTDPPCQAALARLKRWERESPTDGP